MKKMILFVICLLAATMSYASSYATILFDVTWDDPPHVVGESPVVGSNPNCPTEVLKAEVRDGVDGFDGAVAVMIGRENSFLAFVPQLDDLMTSSGVHTISWSSAVLEWERSGSFVQRIDFGSAAFYCSYSYDVNVTNEVRYCFNIYATGSSEPIDYSIPWLEGAVYDFKAVYDLDNGWFNFSINNDIVLTTMNFSEGYCPYGLGFQRYPFDDSGGELAIDNIRWEYMPSGAIPEPATVTLLLLGGGFLAAKKRK
jgi:hypothetical protein